MDGQGRFYVTPPATGYQQQRPPFAGNGQPQQIQQPGQISAQQYLQMRGIQVPPGFQQGVFGQYQAYRTSLAAANSKSSQAQAWLAQNRPPPPPFDPRGPRPMMQQQQQQLSQQPSQQQPKRGRKKKGEVDAGKRKKGDGDESSDFEGTSRDYVSDFFYERRTTVRENRRQVNYAEEVEEEPEEKGEETPKDTRKIDHIFMSRQGKSDREFLVRLSSMPAGLSQWVPEHYLVTISNALTHIQRFNTNAADFDALKAEELCTVTLITHRRSVEDHSMIHFLHKVSWEGQLLFFWDLVDPERQMHYFRTRTRVSLAAAPYRMIETDPTDRTIVSRTGEVMRQYQVDGLKWLLRCWSERHGSILADEMGLGKTIQILAFLSYLNRFMGWHGPFLIAVRTSCFRQWCDEIERWTDLTYIAYNAGPAQRAMLRQFQFAVGDEWGRPCMGVVGFNILLVSYDVFLKDVEFLNKIAWKVLVVDEGHRIKNSQGKKNQAMSNLHATHKIILTGTPIQNTLGELWALLRFVSPGYFAETPSFIDGDVDDLDHETIIRTRDRITPHILRRTVAGVEHSIAPKEERVAFVSLSKTQRNLIRLVKLHKLWRLKGVQTSAVQMDSSHESNAIQKICSHPFLVDGAEQYYTEKLGLTRLEMLLVTSAKLAWLDNVLVNLENNGHRVLIFSQRVKLVRLLNEYCSLRGFSSQMLIGAMTEHDKAEAVSQYSAPGSTDFVFLISTRAGSEGLNLTVADTAIIFDPDWNPQNDLQAQARVHRIGQQKKVDVLRVVTYKTYEHEMFVRAQRKLGLWLTLLGSAPVDDMLGNGEGIPPLLRPPSVERIVDDISLTELLARTSTVVNDYSLPRLKYLEGPCGEEDDYADELSDEAFIETFPVVTDDAGSRRTKRMGNDARVDASTAVIIYNRLPIFGYGYWDDIAESVPGVTSDQVQRFCMCILVYALRAPAVQPSNVFYFPTILQKLCDEVSDFRLKMVMVSGKDKGHEVFGPESDVKMEETAIPFIINDLTVNAMNYLSCVEIKLVANEWARWNGDVDVDWLPPTDENDGDNKIMTALINRTERVDPADPRVMAIFAHMKSDLILSRHDDFAYRSSYWTYPDFQNVVYALRNFAFSPETPLQFHAQTGIVSKTTSEVAAFASQFRRLLCDRRKGTIVVPGTMHKIHEAPGSLANSRGVMAWVNVSIRECEEYKGRIELMTAIKQKYDAMVAANDTELEDWPDFDLTKYVELLLRYGIDTHLQILADRRFGFRELLSYADLRFVCGELEQRKDKNPSAVPDFLFSLDSFTDFMIAGRSSSAAGIGVDGDLDERVQLMMPKTLRLKFGMSSSARKKRKATSRSKDDAEDFTLGRQRRPKPRTPTKASSSDDPSDT